MRDELFSGFSDAGWDEAPWDAEPIFTAEELQVLLNPELSVAEAADRVGCVEHDVRRLRQATKAAVGKMSRHDTETRVRRAGS